MHSTTTKPAEILAAAPDFFALQMGAAPSSATHPLAETLSARKIAYAIGAKLRNPTATEGDMAVVARGLRSSAFGKLLADGARRVTISAYEDGAREHLQFCAVTEVAGFHAETLPSLDADLDLAPLNEMAEVAHGAGFVSTGGAPIELKTFARIVAVSRALLISDQIGALKNIFSATGSHGAQKEAAVIAATMAGNPTMDDGQPLFDSSNTVGALDAASLASALGLLRNQASTAGNALNLRAAHLVVAPELEYAARKAVLDAGLSVAVAALAGLPAARWFLLPGTTTHPVIGLLRLAGEKSPVRLEKKDLFSVDGIAIRVSLDTGAAWLRRTGVIRGGV
jgi:hypothetical protein